MFCICTNMYPYDRMYMVPEMENLEGKLVIKNYLYRSGGTDELACAPALQFVMIPREMAAAAQSAEVRYYEAVTDQKPDLHKNSLFLEMGPFTQKEWFDGEKLTPEEEPYLVVK